MKRGCPVVAHQTAPNSTGYFLSMALVTDAPTARNSESRLFYRFADLKALGIVRCWPTLSRWIAKGDFPAGVYLGANTRAWPVAEIEAWLASRPTGKTFPNGRAGR
jgi:predicted DNA-binding transcriptional regulator AlpA